MAKIPTSKIDVEITEDTIAFLTDFAGKIETLAKALAPFAGAYLGETPEQQHQRLATGQAAPARMREESDKARQDAQNLRGNLADAQAALISQRSHIEALEAIADYDGPTEGKPIYVSDDKLARLVSDQEQQLRHLRQRLRKANDQLLTARMRDQHNVTRWRDAEAAIAQLSARLEGQGNVLEANQQLRSENAELVGTVDRLRALIADLEGQVDELNATKKGRLRAELAVAQQEVDRLQVYERTVDSLGTGADGELVKTIQRLQSRLLGRDAQLAHLRELYDRDAATYRTVLEERDALKAERDQLEQYHGSEAGAERDPGLQTLRDRLLPF